MSIGHPVKTTLTACAVMASLAVVIALVLGHPRAGVALAAGLMIGSVNGLLAQRALRASFSFRATSLGRLGLISMGGLAAGLLLGMDVVVYSLAGLAAAQFVLAAAAARMTVLGAR
ncbi:MAG: hypothetical protein M3Z13_06520 [Candidatus Dormibacteraeota bacterium]|nr:hypothetical protein [Candidatus Dormibacteraeota bacterium]